jgi:hypothetical protein
LDLGLAAALVGPAQLFEARQRLGDASLDLLLGQQGHHRDLGRMEAVEGGCRLRRRPSLHDASGRGVWTVLRVGGLPGLLQVLFDRVGDGIDKGVGHAY